ncbi:MAG TPA: hypothetical protein VGK68_00790 [Gaiellaceae bacterium]
MSDVERIGEAQVAFRNANETIQASADRAAILGNIPFVCECPDGDCMELVQLSFDQYEAIRQHPTRFFNITGHERSSVDRGAERIVVVADELTVVEKIGVAGEVAAEAYPRQS